MAAILLGIDANDLNIVFASRHFIMLKIGKIGDLLSFPARFLAIPNDARSAKFTVAAAAPSASGQLN